MEPNLPQSICKFCGEKFTPTRNWQEFCNNKCRNNYHNDKKYGTYKNSPPPSIRCPHCKSEQDGISPNIFDKVRDQNSFTPARYFCNICGRFFDHQPEPEDPIHPPFTGIVEK